jgi:flagellar biogenesis protein FliO
MARITLLLFALAAIAPLARAEDDGKPGELLRGGGIVQEVQPLRPPPAKNLAPPAPDLRSDFEPLVDDSKPAPLPPKEIKPRRLAARSNPEKKTAATASLAKSTDSLITVGGSLCVVLTLFFGLAWLTRRSQPKQLGKLPGEVIEVLGKAPLTKGQEMQLIRVGAKLLLICVTPTGCETLTEISDHNEVDRLSAICRSSSPSSMTAAFNQVLSGIGREPAAGFAGSARTANTARGRAHA